MVNSANYRGRVAYGGATLANPIPVESTQTRPEVVAAIHEAWHYRRDPKHYGMDSSKISKVNESRGREPVRRALSGRVLSDLL